MKTLLWPKPFFWLFVLFQSIAPASWAGVNQWTSIGPGTGEKITDLVINPKTTSVLYAAKALAV